jgi:hypothetical protein
MGLLLLGVCCLEVWCETYEGDGRHIHEMKDMQKYAFYSTGVCISRRYVMGGLGWVLLLVSWVGLGL